MKIFVVFVVLFGTATCEDAEQRSADPQLALGGIYAGLSPNAYGTAGLLAGTAVPSITKSTQLTSTSLMYPGLSPYSNLGMMDPSLAYNSFSYPGMAYGSLGFPSVGGYGSLAGLGSFGNPSSSLLGLTYPSLLGASPLGYRVMGKRSADPEAKPYYGGYGSYYGGYGSYGYPSSYGYSYPYSYSSYRYPYSYGSYGYNSPYSYRGYYSGYY